MNKILKFLKIKCRGRYVNLIPIINVFYVFEPIKCEKCGKVIVEPKELI